MRYFCLACDYDGTLAHDGTVAPGTLAALRELAASGRKIVLVTGRELDDLLRVFPEMSIFDRVVAENGALLYRPENQSRKVLAAAPPPEFVHELQRRGVPLSAGSCIVATWQPYESVVLDVIRELGVDLQVIFNKHAVMVLPSGVNKGTGLEAALEELDLSPHNVVAVGDAENDHPLLAMCECGVAVANALPKLKERADVVLEGRDGAGVEELIGGLLADDLKSVASRLQRHQILLGHTDTHDPVQLDPYGLRLIVAGPSGGGKSTTVAAIVERLIERKYQICLFDPEGDYDDVEEFVTLGGPNRIPAETEILKILNTRTQSMSINLLGVPLADRPALFLSLLSRVQELRAKTGRPHWIVIDEAHHLLPANHDAGNLAIPKELSSLLLVTVHPDHVAPVILDSLNGLIAIGPDPAGVISQFNAGSGKTLALPQLSGSPLKSGLAVVWLFGEGRPPVNTQIAPAKMEIRRHRRKYASGELGEDKSFYFRGAEGKLNLRAQNMNIFTQLAEGVDEDTWSYHLKNGDYSRWLRISVKDEAAADEVAEIESNASLSPAESRSQVIEAIKRHYTAPV